MFNPPLSPHSNEDTLQQGETHFRSDVADHMVIVFILLSGNEFCYLFVVLNSLRSTSTKSCVDKWGECALFNCKHPGIVFAHLLLLMVVV